MQHSFERKAGKPSIPAPQSLNFQDQRADHRMKTPRNRQVLDQGELLEFDSPARLMGLPGGIFRGLVEEASRWGRPRLGEGGVCMCAAA
jgi:hypothetical protein